MYRVTRTKESGEYTQKDFETVTDALQQLQNWAVRVQLTGEKLTFTIENQ